jgi:putative transposase
MINVMRKHPFAPGEFYHLYDRGVDKREVFLDTVDRDRFVRMLFFCNGTEPVVFRNIPKKALFAKHLDKRGEPLVEIGAYCLMPNHFHLLVRECTEDGISKFMHKLLTGYTAYFNIRYKRTGRLFESSFQSKHADSDRYLKYLFAYIHLNPIKLTTPDWKEKGIGDISEAYACLERFPYSSFHDYGGSNRDMRHILNTTNFPNYFMNHQEFIVEINDWLSFREAGVENDH